MAKGTEARFFTRCGQDNGSRVHSMFPEDRLKHGSDAYSAAKRPQAAKVDIWAQQSPQKYEK